MTTTNHTSPIGEELKPCPFCGETPTMWGNAKVRVECSNADCFVSVHLVPASSEADAISLWNRRAQPIGEDAANVAMEKLRALPWLDKSTADPVEKARRILMHLIEPNSVYYFEDGFPRPELKQQARNCLAVLNALAALSQQKAGE